MLHLPKRWHVTQTRTRVFLLALAFLLGNASLWYASTVNAGISSITPVVKGFTQITSGNDFTCGIANTTAKAYCWGNGQYGRLGTGSTASATSPTPVDTSGVLAGKTILALDAGYNMACAIASDNQAYCWGGNGSGELGNNTTVDASSPVAVNTAGVLSGKTILKITVGHIHVCVIASDNQAYCWGNNIAGQLGNNSITNSSVPVAVDTSGVLSGKTILDITSANFGNTFLAQYYSHTCAIASDNKAYCWGKDNYGQLGDDSTTDSKVPVAVDTTGVLLGKTVTSISGGHFNTCVIASGEAFCWGAGTSGALGNNAIAQSNIPVAVTNTGVLAGKTLTTVSSSGYDSSCVLDTAGLAYCWGMGLNGQLGNNSSINSWVPVAVYTGGWLSGKTISSISANGETAGHVCAITTDNAGYCWGSNAKGEIYSKYVPKGSSTNAPVPLFLENDPFRGSSWRTYANVDSITPGAPLAATETVPSVSNNASFRLRSGIGSTPLMSTVKTGGAFTCGLTKDEQVFCWGDNTYGQLGNNSTTRSLNPVPLTMSGVLAGKTIKAITTGDAHTCVIASDNKPYCWGLGTSGQLGNNTATSSSVPVAVDVTGALSGKTVMAISAGTAFTCVIASDNKPYCWGLGTSGQLGNNATANSSVPVAVSTSSPSTLNGKTVKSISAGYAHACVIASDSSANCWGLGTSGQLGNNTAANSSVPVAVSITLPSALTGKTVKSISAGYIHTCVVASDDLAYCWGDGSIGRLGNNSGVQSNVPVAVDTSGVLSGKTILSISSGWTHTCAIASDNLGYCWGDNGQGQMGNPTYSYPSDNSLVPAEVAGLFSYETISASAAHTCAVSVTSVIYCWGDNTSWQLSNDNIITPTTSPEIIKMSYIAGPHIYAGDNTYKLRFAVRSAAVCLLQTTGFADVTNSSAIAYNDNPSVANNTAISSTANDPVAAADVALQTYQDTPGIFTNSSSVPSGKSGLWDFSLKTNGAVSGKNYCIAITYSDGTPLEQPQYYPEIAVGAAPFSVGFVDGSGNSIASPTFTFSGVNVDTKTSQASTSSFGDATHKLRLTNTSASNGWSVSIAATNGPTSYWKRADNLAQYDFNDISAGQLSISPSVATITPQAGCTNTGVSSGSSANFLQGTVDSITLFSGSASSQLNCYWDYYGAALTQTVPKAQPAGTYTIDMTATVVAL